MAFQHVLERLKYSPWFCTPAAYSAMATVVDACVERMKAGGDFPEPKMEGFSLRDMQSRRPMMIDQNEIAHIHVFGTMGRNLAPIENMCGRTDYAMIEKEAVEAKSRARAVLFEFDTPGGSALGVDQTAQKLGLLGMPTAGFTETLCASAGVYLASGLDRIFCASGAVYGSIGTVMPWVDTSKMQELMKIKTEVFVNEGASLKGMRSEVPLTEEQRGHLQEFVNDLGAMFRNHVENHRRVDAEVFKAGAYVAERALDLGLVDEIGGREEAASYLLTKLRG